VIDTAHGHSASVAAVVERIKRENNRLQIIAGNVATYDATRALIDEGMPASQVFAAAFGAEQPVASNTDESGRAQNRRVEMAPVPKAPNVKPARND